MAERTTSGGVQSVERVFHLLEVITAAGGEMSLSELSAAVNLPLPTIHRLLRTLVPSGYVRQLPNRSYALGPRLIPLGERAGRQLGRVAQPKLVELVRQLGTSPPFRLLDVARGFLGAVDKVEAVNLLLVDYGQELVFENEVGGIGEILGGQQFAREVDMEAPTKPAEDKKK